MSTSIRRLIAAIALAALFAGLGKGQTSPDRAMFFIDPRQDDFEPKLFVRVFLKGVHNPNLESIDRR